MAQGGTTNLYEYCRNDPVNRTDPDGLIPRSIWTKAERDYPNEFRAAQKAIDQLTNKAFDYEEQQRLKELLLDEIGLWDAKKFLEIDPYESPMLLTKDQKDIIDELFGDLLDDDDLSKSDLDLLKRARDQLSQALKEKRCVVEQ